MPSPDEAVSPKDLSPKAIREFPAIIERCEKLRRLARQHANDYKHDMQVIEDKILREIESEIIEVPIKSGTIQKKKFKSESSRQSELRRRLLHHGEYEMLRQRQNDWTERCAEWVSHTARLRRDLRIMEIDYASNGGGI